MIKILKICKVCRKEVEFGKSRATTCHTCVTDGYKWCHRCGIVKNVEDFSRSGKGLMNICKVCHNIRNRQWRQTEDGNAKANCTNKVYRASMENKIKHILLNQLHKAAGNLTINEWNDIVERFSNECAYCGKKHNLTMDHVTPISKGGKTTCCNIIPACGTCNSSKGARDMVTWYTSQIFYSEERLVQIQKFLRSRR